MTIPVLAPYRADGDHRDKLWAYLKANYWDCDLYRVIEGESPEGPFNRSAAINDAARKAGDWDVAVIADADTWVPANQIDEAVQTARRTGRLVSALTSVIELSETATRAILDQDFVPLLDLSADRVRTDDFVTQSSVLAVPRKLWDRIGGFDEGFVGWAAEDNVFFWAATILGGTPLRIDGAAFHLWHPTTDVVTRSMDPQWRANWQRWKRYEAATCECSLRKVQQS